jgi:hypothetical protein
MPELTHTYRWGAERVAFRLFVRELKAGALWILLGALVLSVMALSSVAFITERVGGALNQQANQLLAGDAVLRSESALDAGLIEQAQTAGLRSAQSASLLSMVRVLPTAGGEGAMRLSELRAVTADFPLRGELIVRAEDGVDRATQRGPAPGTAWLSVSGAANLDAKVGDQLKVGELQLRLSALIVQQPDASLDYFNAGPRLMLSLADLQKSGLLQEGARVGYRLIVAGDAAAVRAITARWHRNLAQRTAGIATRAGARGSVFGANGAVVRGFGGSRHRNGCEAASGTANGCRGGDALLRCRTKNLAANFPQSTCDRWRAGVRNGRAAGVGFAVGRRPMVGPRLANRIARGIVAACREWPAGRYGGAAEFCHAADFAIASGARIARVAS